VVRRPIHLELTRHSYPLEAADEQSWLGLAFRAFSRIARSTEVRDLLILGTGNGLDALGALEIFDLRSLTITDLHDESVSVSRRNVLAHLVRGAEVEISFHAGDLLSCVPADKRFCLIYENLPNVRATPSMDLEHGTIAGRFYAAREISVPDTFVTHLVALHYECLQKARAHVRQGGGVLTALGGRIPLEIALELHRSCGYVPELVAFDVKRQSEPDLILPGYRDAEEAYGVEFTFYAPQALELLAEARSSGLEGRDLLDAVDDELRLYAISAREAMRRRAQDEPVAHSVFEILGTWHDGRGP
jgi:hypothetical protein